MPPPAMPPQQNMYMPQPFPPPGQFQQDDPEALRKQLVGAANQAVPLPDVPQLSFAPPPKPPPVPINLSNLDRLMLSMYGQGGIRQFGGMSSIRPAYVPEGYRLNTTTRLSDPHMGTWDTQYSFQPLPGTTYSSPMGTVTYPFGGGRPFFGRS